MSMDFRLEVVQILMSDVDLARRFYSEQAGFVVDLDWNSSAFFSDPDGNGWVLQERPAHD